MSTRPLSIVPYYGGKAKMAALISDMLDYSETTIYIEPFGGGCRTLLNKPRHLKEIYNDSSAGLCAMVELLSCPTTAMEFISRLYETEYSEECFAWAFNVRNGNEDNYYKEIKRRMNRFIKDIERKYGIDYFREFKRSKGSDARINKMTSSVHLDENERRIGQLYIEEYETIKKEIAKYGEDAAENTRSVVMDKMELAVATYVLYQQSFNAIGCTWNKHKFKTNDNYYKRIDSLYDVMNRLEGVIVTQVDAMAYFNNDDFLNDPHVMIYCDPTYLKEADFKKNKGIEIKAKHGKEYNPGKAYKHYWSRKDHEKFLKRIQKAQCKLLVSNYDDKEHLYIKYLEDGKGLNPEEKKCWKPWSRLEYQTKTTISNGENSSRTECLWYNYEI